MKKLEETKENKEILKNESKSKNPFVDVFSRWYFWLAVFIWSLPEIIVLFSGDVTFFEYLGRIAGNIFFMFIIFIFVIFVNHQIINRIKEKIKNKKK